MSWRGRNIRLHVFLSHAGVASRRAAEEIIASGRVSVNGITITAQGTKVEEGDTVLLDGKPVQLETDRHYLALNKPPGYICSSSDPQGRPLALSLLPASKERLYNVGRLDFQSCGLIFFTNDGTFASRLGHPSHNLEKEYIVEAAGPIRDEAVEAFRAGITIEDVYYKAKTAEKTGIKTMRIVLVEGKNREIRRVFSHFHLHPEVLRRVRIGNVLLGSLPEGSSRPLTKDELSGLESTQGVSKSW
ncbi:MAG: rRNA pseudouridine synthase [Treponema sp.]|nr:rRNA pseudouridine synthase [Treponema sp.]